jgi:hypothetical protein
VRPIPSTIIDKLVRKERTRYESQGREFNYIFTPEAGKTYEVTIEILKGFDQGNRRIHFHLGSTAYYNLLVYTLDLQKYLQAGYRITQRPLFFFEDTEEHRCEEIWNSPSFEPIASDPNGIWQWELHHVRQGAIGLLWDLDH